MASLRKRYQSHVEVPDRDGPPVQSAPTTAAQPPEPAADTTQPIEPMATESPAAVAASSAIRDRLRERDAAENLVQATATHQQHVAAQVQQAAQSIPEHVQEWLKEHPQYLNIQDPVAQAEINLATLKAIRDGKTWHDPGFLETVERHLGLAPATNGRAAERPAEIERPPAAPTPRPAPVRQHVGPPVAAPGGREPPAMTSGRVPSDVRLSAEEVEIARASGITPQEYAEKKKLMLQLKAAGAIQG